MRDVNRNFQLTVAYLGQLYLPKFTSKKIKKIDPLDNCIHPWRYPHLKPVHKTSMLKKVF